MKEQKITRELLKEYLSYNYLTGEFTCIKDISCFYKKGSNVGLIDSYSGYVRINFAGKYYYAHHLAWLYHYGSLPFCLDHINRNRSDNRISNLRFSTPETNSKNMSKFKTNTSGFTGVYPNINGNKWVAKIAGKHLGTFETREEAFKFREQIKLELGFDKTHGI